MQPWKWYIYILQCSDGSYYTGITWSPSTRWEQHTSKQGNGYTQRKGVEKILYLEEYEQLDVARRRELQIKGWSRKKKEKLISGEWTKWEYFGNPSTSSGNI